MWARRTRTAKRNSYGVATIRRDTYNSRNGMSLKSGDGWWEIRGKVWKRDGGKCQALVGGNRCLKPGKDVHHIKPLSGGGTTTMSNLITLCQDCHDRRHRHMFKARG